MDGISTRELLVPAAEIVAQPPFNRGAVSPARSCGSAPVRSRRSGWAPPLWWDYSLACCLPACSPFRPWLRAPERIDWQRDGAPTISVKISADKNFRNARNFSKSLCRIVEKKQSA